MNPEPFRIEPTFSPRLWGSRSLAPIFPNKTNLAEPIGEAWLTDVNCRIATGSFSGISLKEAWPEMPAEWRGTMFQQPETFPLLAKFIFPTDKLSIQVHPDDTYAAAHEQASGGRGKTEMWRIISAKSDASLLLGLKPGATKETFVAALKDNTLESLFQRHLVKPGDTFFVPARTQHTIGANMVVFEVQEYSDLTYRVYDYGRVDPSGKPRELHIEKALEVTNFTVGNGGKTEPLALHSPDASKHLLAACKFFATERWDCNRTTPIESDPQEFQLFVILEGTGAFYDAEQAFPYHPGEAWFLPANLPTLLLQPDGVSSVLRVTLPDTGALRRQLRNQGFEDQAISRVVIGAE